VNRLSPKILIHCYVFFFGWSIAEGVIHDKWYSFYLAMMMLLGAMAGWLTAKCVLQIRKRNLLPETDCYLTAQFLCSCGERNSISFGSPLRCRACGKSGDNIEILGIPKIVAEFICDNCGRTNPIMGRVVNREERKIEDEADYWKPEDERDGLVVTTTVNEFATKETCAYCKSQYRLVFVEPERLG
jgi:hypothetical protein